MRARSSRRRRSRFAQGDDPDSLADRVIVQERRLYPEVLALVAGGRARLEGDRVEIADAAPDGVLFSL